MHKKIKKSLLMIIIMFLIMNVIVTIRFYNNVAISLQQTNGYTAPFDYLFSVDTTVMFSFLNSLPNSLFDNSIMLIRIILVIAMFAISIYLICIRESKGIVICLICVAIICLINIVGLAHSGQGIWLEFRRAKLAYDFGLIRMPWMPYYLITIILPSIIACISLTKNLFKRKSISL